MSSSSHAVRADRVSFIHQNGHTNQENVKFFTSGNFDLQKPIEVPSIIMRGNYRLYVDPAEDKLFIQKKIGGVFVSKFSFSFS